MQQIRSEQLRDGCRVRLPYGEQAGDRSDVQLSEILVTRIPDSDDAVTEMIRRWTDGDAVAGDRLFALIYDELRTIARRQRRRWHGDDTLNTTALVHELFLRMQGARALSVHDRAHFYALAARATRQILSNYARRTLTEKRGTGATTVALADAAAVPATEARGLEVERLWALELALQELQRLHPRPCRVVECRYFGGLSISDTALALNISEATVKRDWTVAQVWLYRQLRDQGLSDA